jgi:hypothetical protein
VIINGVVAKNPARERYVAICRPRHVRWYVAGAVLLGLMTAGCGVQGSGSGFPNPPRQSPVTTVLVSSDGRIITGVSGMACGHVPRLVARSYPQKVTLIWVNPDTNCNAETLRSAVVRIGLAEPLSNRSLVQASGSGQIPYFDQSDLARVTALPAGFQLSSELPAGQPVGDKRTYTAPPGTGAAWPGWPCQCTQLVIWQQVVSKGFIPPTQQNSRRAVYVRVHGHLAALLDGGPFYARSVNWMEHGYYFTVGVGNTKLPLTNAQLIAVADGIRPPRGG